MGIPRGRGVEIPVGVGDDDMGFPRGDAGELEGHAGEDVGAVAGLLAEPEVGAFDLIMDMPVPRDGVHEDAVLPDGERVDRGVGEEIAFPNMGLLQRVGAVGQGVRRCGGVPVLDGEGRYDLALIVGFAVHDDRLLAGGAHLEHGAIEGCAAERRVQVAFLIVLVDLHAAPDHLFRSLRRLVGDGVLHGLLLNLLEAVEPFVEEIPFRRMGFIYDDGTAREHGLSVGVPVQVIPGHQMGVIEGSLPAIVGGDDPCAQGRDPRRLERVVILVAEGVVVFDGELRALQRGVALRQAVLPVILGDHQPGGFIGRDIRERDGGGLLRGNGDGLFRCGEESLGGLGFADRDGGACGQLQAACGAVLPHGEDAQHTAVLTVDGELRARQ